ncbi:putative thioredoxine [Blastocystis sp. subtype 1]
MKGVVLLFLTLSLALSEIADNDDVITFTDKNADELFEEYNPVLLQFDAPVMAVQQMKIDKEYAKAARILGDLDDPLYLAKVDASKNPALVKKYNIRQFPSILFIRNGIAVEYNWGLKTDDFVEFMKEKAGLIAETYPTVKALKEALKSSDFAVVGYFQSTKCEEYKQWENEILHLGVEHAIYITSASIAEAMGAKVPRRSCAGGCW